MPKHPGVSETTPEAANAKTPEVTPAMSTEQLLALVVSMQKQLADVLAAQTANSDKQTEAILELARPKEPVKTARQIADEKNEEQFKKQQAEQEKWAKANEKWAHENCEHIAGCNALSEMKDLAQRTSIIWHRGDVGQTTGICTVCQRIFKESDPDFAKWRKLKSFNKDSASGQRTVLDPLAAREKSYLHDS